MTTSSSKQPKSGRGEELNLQWKVGAHHALYRRDGTWYHLLQRFPGALFDENGYLLFKTEADYRQSPYLHIMKETTVRDRRGISVLPGYKRVRIDDKAIAANALPLPAIASNSLKRKSLPSRSFSEGGVAEIVIELQRRSPKLRAQALSEYGNSCQICGFNFGKFYGVLGEGYIEVHHLIPLSTRKGQRLVTTQDVMVVCANCHRVLHRNGKVPISPDELRKAIMKAH